MAQELRKLQDDAPHVDFAEIRRSLDEQFGVNVDELFASIDETPLAAASMAQVHRAVLPDGDGVVIKVLRPGIEAVIESDLGLMREIAGFVEKHFESQPFSPTAVVEEFSKQITKELNLATEARSTARLRRLFEDDPNVTLPRVFTKHSTTRVLTLEAIEGRSHRRRGRRGVPRGGVTPPAFWPRPAGWVGAGGEAMGGQGPRPHRRARE